MYSISKWIAKNPKIYANLRFMSKKEKPLCSKKKRTIIKGKPVFAVKMIGTNANKK